jgi:hypothetical protein
VHTEWKLINSFPFHPDIINPDLWVRHTTAVSWFWVWFILDLAVTPCRSCKMEKRRKKN